MLNLVIILSAALLALAWLGIMGRNGYYAQRFRANDLQRQLDKVTHTLSSIRVKHGQSWETFLPVMKKFEESIGPKENAVFLGRPIDLIYFNKDELVFVEIKTGKSTLSSKQRRIRNLIQQHKVRWEEVSDA